MTVAVMMGLGITSKYTTSVFSDSIIPVMCKGTDIGPMIPHIGVPSTTLMIEIATSGSKSHFGPSYYHVKDQTDAPGNPAVALLMSVNPNLNCGYPFPTPSGMVMALTTQALGMTWGDIVGGLYQMALDFALQAILQKVGSLMGDVAKSLAMDMGIGALMALGPLERLLRVEVGPLLGRFAQVADKVVPIVVGQLVGTPLGTTSGTFGIPGFYDAISSLTGVDQDPLGDQFGRAFDNYLNSPSVEDVNQPDSPTSAEPTDGGLPPGGVPDNPDGGVPGGDSASGDPADAGVGTSDASSGSGTTPGSGGGTDTET
jgi:hypothetical protein